MMTNLSESESKIHFLSQLSYRAAKVLVCVRTPVRHVCVCVPVGGMVVVQNGCLLASG